MPIFVGTSDIDDIRVGDDSSIFHSVWKGSTRIWARPLLYTLTIGTLTNSVHQKKGFDTSASIGSIDFVSGHNLYTSDWFLSSGGQSHSQYIYSLYHLNEFASNTNDGVILTIGSTNTLAQSIPNTDATFSRLSIDDDVFNRTDATYTYNVGSNFSTWKWSTSTSPFKTSGTENIRFDKP